MTAGRGQGTGAPDRGGRAHPLAVLGFACIALALVATAASVALGSRPPASDAAPSPMTVSPSTCGAGWTVPAAGVVTYEVTDRSPVAIDPELVDRADGAVVSSIKVLGPGTTRPLSVRLSRGTYRWLCVYDQRPDTFSTTLAVTGGVPPGTATPAVIQPTVVEMSGPLHDYDLYVAGQISLLSTQVAVLGQDVAQGNLAQAKVDWLTAHLTYCRIGGTYGALNGLEQVIDGTARALPGGVDNPSFTGFHQIEQQLWSGQSAAAIAPSVTALINAVDQLEIFWPEAPMTANLLSTRAHEILEDTLRDTLTGQDDYGSGTSLATTLADVQGEQVVLGDLSGVIAVRAPHLLGTVEPELRALRQTLLSTQVDGQWVPLSALSTPVRERIDGQVGQIVENLSPIPDVLEVQQFSDVQGS